MAAILDPVHTNRVFTDDNDDGIFSPEVIDLHSDKPEALWWMSKEGTARCSSVFWIKAIVPV